MMNPYLLFQVGMLILVSFLLGVTVVLGVAIKNAGKKSLRVVVAIIILILLVFWWAGIIYTEHKMCGLMGL